MNSIRRHIPGCCSDGDEPPEIVEFNTMEQLLSVPFVNSFSGGQRFHRYSLSRNHLMAEYRDGKEWWVVGTLKYPVAGLPEWDRGIYECLENGKSIDIAGADVKMSCGDDVTLNDGRVLKRRRP